MTGDEAVGGGTVTSSSAASALSKTFNIVNCSAAGAVTAAFSKTGRTTLSQTFPIIIIYNSFLSMDPAFPALASFATTGHSTATGTNKQIIIQLS